MRRTIALLSFFLLAACDGQNESGGQDEASPERAETMTVYSGPGRNQLCLKGQRAGFIVYASTGDRNCSVRGTVDRTGSDLVISPDGDSECRIGAREDASSLTLGPVSSACSYYCGPDANFEGATFDMVPASRPVTDFAGDPLC